MKVLVFCAKGFETMEFAPFIDVCGWARNDFGYEIEVETCGVEERVISTFGVPVIVDRRLDEISAEDYDGLAIPGGFEEYGFYEEAYDEGVLQLIRDFHRLGKPVAAVCVGALALGRSGVLEGHKGTTYHLKDGYRQKELRKYGVQVVQESVVVDGDLITSSCPETAVHVAFELLRKLVGSGKMMEVKKAMGYM